MVAGHDIAAPDIPDIREQPPETGIVQLQVVAVRYRDGQPDTRQQITRCPHIDLGMNMCGYPVTLGFHDQGFEGWKALRADHRRQQQSIRNQYPPAQDKRSGQVVYRVQRANIDDQVEAVISERQTIIIAYYAARCRGSSRPSLPAAIPIISARRNVRLTTSRRSRISSTMICERKSSPPALV